MEPLRRQATSAQSIILQPTMGDKLSDKATIKTGSTHFVWFRSCMKRLLRLRDSLLDGADVYQNSLRMVPIANAIHRNHLPAHMAQFLYSSSKLHYSYQDIWKWEALVSFYRLWMLLRTLKCPDSGISCLRKHKWSEACHNVITSTLASVHSDIESLDWGSQHSAC